MNEDLKSSPVPSVLPSQKDSVQQSEVEVWELTEIRSEAVSHQTTAPAAALSPEVCYPVRLLARNGSRINQKKKTKN